MLSWLGLQRVKVRCPAFRAGGLGAHGVELVCATPRAWVLFAKIKRRPKQITIRWNHCGGLLGFLSPLLLGSGNLPEVGKTGSLGATLGFHEMGNREQRHENDGDQDEDDFQDRESGFAGGFRMQGTRS